jgi:hypothetical protein
MKRVNLTFKVASSVLLVWGMAASNTLANYLPSYLPRIEYLFDDQYDFANKIVRNHYYTDYNGKINGYAQEAPGVLGKSLQLNDSNVYVEVSNSQSLNFSKGLTLEAHVWRSSNVNEDAVISKWYGSDQFLLTFNREGNGLLRFQIRFPDGTYGNVDYMIPDSYYLNQWVRVTATYNGYGQLKLYWKGKQVAEKYYQKYGIASGYRPINIGDAGNDWSRFNGRIDEVRIWPRALSSSEIGEAQRR